MRISRSLFFTLITILLFTTSLSLLTSKMASKKFAQEKGLKATSSDNAPNVKTSCNRLDFSKTYNYSGIVASGYLTVGKNNSALAYVFYGQKDVRN